MKQLVKMSTLPYYSQIAIFDGSVKDAYPEWDGDNTSVATTAFGVAVATRPDHLGPVEVDVVVGSLEDDPGIREVHHGTVDVRGDQGLLVS